MGRFVQVLVDSQVAISSAALESSCFSASAVVFTAIATLFTKGHLKLLEISEPAFLGLTQKKSQRLVRGDQPARDALEIEHVLYAAADEEGEVKLQQIIEAGMPLGEAYRDQLREVGLVEPDPPKHWSYRITPSLLMGGILLVGLIKLAVGLSRNRPVDILIFLLLVTGVLTAYFLFSKRYLTPSGRKLSRQLVKQNQNLRTSSASTEQLSLADVAMTTAVFGATRWQVHDGGLADLHGMMHRQKVFGVTGSDGGCGAGGCGGGGGGCGGCGG